MEARYYLKKDNNKVLCTLCPNNCGLSEGQAGVCHIRKNEGGKLIATTYRKYSALAFDPIEKKPLYHFYPGKEILSLGSIGCNMHCNWCQNCEISQSGVVEFTRGLQELMPEQIIKSSLHHHNNIGVAFTYNEPAISIETNMEVASLIKEEGQKTVMVTNGYLNSDALQEYLSVIDAFNVDVKAFDEKTYKQYTGGSLRTVQESLLAIKKAGKHLEITILVVPGISDGEKDFQGFLEWLAGNLGNDTVIHLSRYFPRYKMKTEATAETSLKNLAAIASNYLTYVYLGNINTEVFSNTRCPGCNSIMIERNGYHIRKLTEIKCGFCTTCGIKICEDDKLVKKN